MRTICFYLFFVLISSASVLYSQTLSIQGVLRDASGNAITDGSYPVIFSIYSDTTASALYVENQNVTVSGGVYSAQIGSGSATTGTWATLPFDRQYYLGVKVQNVQLSPYIVLSASPYAFAIRGTSNLISGGGNVGIGTISPSQSLEVASGHVKVSTGNLYIASPSSTPSSGRLGIGTTSPSAPLDVRGNAAVTGTLTANSLTVTNNISLGGHFNGNVQASSFTTNGTSLIATMATSPLRFISGTINADGSVSNVTGTDFTVTKYGTGLYKVVFNYIPTTIYNVQIQPFTTLGDGTDVRFFGNVNKFTDNGNSTYTIQVKMQNVNGTPTDVSFFFLAIASN